MLESAQQPIAAGQLLGRLARDPTLARQHPERPQRLRLAQLGASPAQDELLGLNEELDLADAAAADLEIVAQHADGAEAPMGVDLTLDRMDVPDRGVVEMLAPHIGLEHAQEGLTGPAVPRHDARLDERRTLPVLAVPLVVELGRVGREGERMAGDMRPEAQVGPEHVAVSGLLLEQIDERAGQACGQRHRRLRPPIGQTLLVEEDDEVDIARVVELARTVLAHAEHEDAARAHRIVAGLGRQLAAGDGVADEVPNGLPDHEIGELGERARHGLERPSLAEIGQRHVQRPAPPQPSQRRHEPRPVGRLDGLGLAAQLGLGLVGPTLEEGTDDLGLGDRAVGEEGTATEEAVQQPPPSRLVEAARDEGGETRVGGTGADLLPAAATSLRGRLVAGERRRELVGNGRFGHAPRPSGKGGRCGPDQRRSSPLPGHAARRP